MLRPRSPPTAPPRRRLSLFNDRGTWQALSFGLTADTWALEQARGVLPFEGSLELEWCTPEMHDWVNAKDFHTLPEVAVGCKVMLTYNIDLSQRACNGALGQVTGLTYRSGRISCVNVELQEGVALIAVRRLTVGSTARRRGR